MIGQFAKKEVVKATPSTSIRDVAKLMAENNVGLVVLVDPRDPQRVVGVVSERDVVRAVAYGVDLGQPCDIIATKRVITLEHDRSLAEAAEVFRKYGIRHIVVTQGGKLYGVLSIRDLIREDAALREAVAFQEWTFEPGMSA